jgi:hypothetical protein
MSTYVGGGGGDAVARQGLEVPTHDYISNTYDGSNNLTETVFKRGGSSGVTVAMLTYTYDGSGNLLTVTRA